MKKEKRIVKQPLCRKYYYSDKSMFEPCLEDTQMRFQLGQKFFNFPGCCVDRRGIIGANSVAA